MYYIYQTHIYKGEQVNIYQKDACISCVEITLIGYLYSPSFLKILMITYVIKMKLPKPNSGGDTSPARQSLPSNKASVPEMGCI